jgi:enediyne biosynthesis protein E7
VAKTLDAPAVPPGPAEPIPIAEIRRDPLSFLRRLTAEYGDVTRHETEDGPVVTVNRADLARHVLRGRDRNYVKSGTPDDAMLTPLLGRGLLTSEGETWKRQRRITQPAFDRTRVEGLGALIVDEAVAQVERWRPAIESGAPVRLDHDLSSLTLAVVSRAILGSDVSGIGRGFGEAVDTVNRFMGHYDPLLPGSEGAEARAAFGKALGFLDGLVGLLVSGRRASGERGDDLLGRLLEVGFGEREIRDQVLTMLMAGHETTAKALGWTTYLLDRNPEIAGRLDADLARVIGDRDPTAADLARLPLLANVVSESLRLYPPVWLISRKALADDVLGDYAVPAGSLVCVSPYLLHRHPAYWDEPERFDPGRFDEARSAGRPEFAYIPFSGGPRRCIGERLALFEAQLVLATLRLRTAVQLVPEHPVEPEALVTLRPRDGLLARISAR